MQTRGESIGDHWEMKQQQEKNVEGEDQEEMFSDTTSFPFPFLHLAVLHISGS